ncbi:MAG: GNAT family N-acetyltransferase [Burkholderiales bacterium]|nr:GNAT family N-acetyltransferase [Burkholderiales bacterium]
MGVRFVPFAEADFHAWLLQAIPAFALSNVRDGRWSLAEAIVKSQEAHAALLPQGLATPGQFFMHLHDEAGGQRVGSLWWSEGETGGRREAYVYNIEIDEAARRLGHARAAFAELERVARAHGMQQVGLHVFGHNAGARRLYDELGFEPTSITMRKVL